MRPATLAGPDLSKSHAFVFGHRLPVSEPSRLPWCTRSLRASHVNMSRTTGHLLHRYIWETDNAVLQESFRSGEDESV